MRLAIARTHKVLLGLINVCTSAVRRSCISISSRTTVIGLRDHHMMIWNDADTVHLWKATVAGAEWSIPKDRVLAAAQSVLVGKYHRCHLPPIQMDTGQYWCS